MRKAPILAGAAVLGAYFLGSERDALSSRFRELTSGQRGNYPAAQMWREGSGNVLRVDDAPLSTDGKYTRPKTTKNEWFPIEMEEVPEFIKKRLAFYIRHSKREDLNLKIKTTFRERRVGNIKLFKYFEHYSDPKQGVNLKKSTGNIQLFGVPDNPESFHCETPFYYHWDSITERELTYDDENDFVAFVHYVHSIRKSSRWAQLSKEPEKLDTGHISLLIWNGDYLRDWRKLLEKELTQVGFLSGDTNNSPETLIKFPE